MMAASQGCTGLGVWPYTEGSLVQVKDPYARQKLQERAKKMMQQYLLFSFGALIGFLCFARFVIEPVLAPREEGDGVCPIGSITNTTCNGRGTCNVGKDTCICGMGIGLYEGKVCDEISPAFIIGISILALFLGFTANIIYLASVSKNGNGAPWIFDKKGNNIVRMKEMKALVDKKRKQG